MRNFLIFGVVIYALMKGAELALAAKPGVILATTWQVHEMRAAVNRVWSKRNLTATITSSLDGIHMDGSLHYDGLAEDYRTKDIPSRVTKMAMFEEVRQILGSDYQVIFEHEGKPNEHLHIEFQPI